MRLYDWLTILMSLSSAGLLLPTGLTLFRLSRSAKGMTPGQARLFLGLTLLLLFVSLMVAATLLRRGEHGASPEFLLVGVLVLSSCLLVAIIVRHHERLEELIAMRTEEITTANQRLESLLDNMPAGVVFSRAEGGELMVVNRKATEMLGIRPDTRQLALPATGEAFCKPDGKPYPLEDLPLARTLRTAQPCSADDLIVQRPGRERLKLLMTASPVLDDSGAMSSAICVFQDVSERERLEALRDSLMHIIVHDLRNPLHAIAGYLELLAECGFISQDRDSQEYFRHVRTNCQSLVNMTTALLDLSKMEAGELELTARELRLRDVWLEVHAEVASLARLKQLSVVVKIPPRLSPVSADRSMLRRVLVNLMTNAICFAPMGSTINVLAQRQDDFERVSVVDQGPGIAPEYHDLIFRKSGRLETGAKGTYFSTGLGLAFCKMAVEMMGGTIGVESEVGSGSTFWFCVPVARGGERDAAPRPARPREVVMPPEPAAAVPLGAEAVSP